MKNISKVALVNVIACKIEIVFLLKCRMWGSAILMSAVFDVFISIKYRSGVPSLSIDVHVHGETWLKPVEHRSSNQDELPNGN